MIETDSMNFITAIALTTVVIVLVVGMYALVLVVSGKRLQKTERLAAAALESSPAFISLVFDGQDRVTDLKVQNPAAEKHFRATFINKKKQELSFMPKEWQNLGLDAAPAPENGGATAPLTLPDGNTLYLKWKMQDFSNDDGATELRIARGYDMTTELLQTQRMLKKLSATVSEREEQERRRISEDLHDHLGEVVVTSRQLIQAMKKKSPSPEFSRNLEELDGAITKLNRNTGSVIAELAPRGLFNIGFVAALEGLIGEFKRRHQISICLENAWPDGQLNHEVATFLYKAVREFLLNAMKHGGADEILIALTRTEAALTVTVQDNGSGFDETAPPPLAPGADSGFGLFNFKNRAEYYGGDLAIGQSAELGGGKITVWVAPAKALRI